MFQIISKVDLFTFRLTPLSLRGGRQDDGAIHRVSRDTVWVVCSGSEGQWIATGFLPSR